MTIKAPRHVCLSQHWFSQLTNDITGQKKKGSSFPASAPPPRFGPSALVSHGTGLLGLAPADKHTFSAHPKPQLQHGWRYILSTACFLAPVQPHNEWSRSPPPPPQPGATPSTLFTLLPFTHSSCSSPNDAGPNYCWSNAGRTALFLAGLQTRPFPVF